MRLWNTLSSPIKTALAKLKSSYQSFTSRFGGTKKLAWTSLESFTRGLARFSSLKTLVRNLLSLFGEGLNFLGALSTLPAFFIITGLVTLSTFYALHKDKTQQSTGLWQHTKNFFSLLDIPLRSLARVSNTTSLLMIIGTSGSAVVSLILITTFLLTTWSSYKTIMRNRAIEPNQDNNYLSRAIDALFRGISRGFSCLNLVEFFTMRVDTTAQILSLTLPSFVGISSSYLITIKPSAITESPKLQSQEESRVLNKALSIEQAGSESTALLPVKEKASHQGITNTCKNHQWLISLYIIDGLLRGGLARTTNQMQLLSEISYFNNGILFSLPYMLIAGTSNSYCSTQLVKQPPPVKTTTQSYLFANREPECIVPTPEIVVENSAHPA
ncbi:MAG: hypothetical protein K0S08_89 [Gammaproteobacteria bacterium]|jgi:hypothetical protein|nr:hypothetical protein [Gammaproteobacteria bacterium]